MEPLAIPPAVLELSETISRASSAIDQTLVEGPQEETRKKLKEELNTLNDTINAFTTNDDCQEEYRERLHKLEPMCSQGGAITQAVQLVGKIVLPSPDARENKAFPLSQEDMVRYILEVKMCKRAIADALSGDFDASQNLDPKVREALKLYDWLDTIDVTETQDILSRRREKDTCTWLFDGTTCKPYTEWSSADSGTLWLHGRAGTGKSVIACAYFLSKTLLSILIAHSAAVVDHLLTEGDRVHSTKQTGAENAKTGAEVPFQDSVAYYFCDFHDARSLRLRTILLSIFLQFAQMVEERVLDIFPDLARRQNQGRAPPEDIDTLQDLLVQAMRLHKNKVIVVGGLDECEDAPAVLTCLRNIAVSEKNVRVLVTSRPDQPFVDSFDRDLTINLEDYIECTNGDIRTMLGGRIERHRRLSAVPDPTREEIIDTITEKAYGSFWTAQCQLDLLRECRSVRSVQNIIRNLPTDLPGTYDAILEHVDKMTEDVRLILQRTLRWLGGSLRPMTIAQAMECPTVDVTKHHLDDNISVVSDEDFFLVCGALVVHDGPTKRVALGNRTVLDYLTGTPTKNELSRYFFNIQEVQKELALGCLTYILSEDIGKAVADVQKLQYESARRYALLDRRPLLLYALDGGFEHVQRITAEDNDDVIDLMQRLQDHIEGNQQTYSMVVDSLNDHHCRDVCRWIMDERELVLGIVLRFGPPWMVRRFLLRRGDLLAGEAGGKLLGRVAELQRTSELAEMVRDMVSL